MMQRIDSILNKCELLSTLPFVHYVNILLKLQHFYNMIALFDTTQSSVNIVQSPSNEHRCGVRNRNYQSTVFIAGIK